MERVNRLKGGQLLLGLLLCVGLLAGCAGNSTLNGMDLGQADGEVNAIAATGQATAAINQKIEEQYDKYAVYYPADVYQELLNSIIGSYTGAGIYIYEDEETGLVTISGVMKNTPAFKAGMQPGDRFLKINGENVTGRTLEDVSAQLKAYPAGTKVNITLQRQDVGEVQVQVTLENVEIPTLEGKVLQTGNGQSIGIIKIVSFNKTTGQQFVTELQSMLGQNISGLILDLRDNGGGEVTAALQVCDVFTPKGKPMMYVTDPTGTLYYEAATDKTELSVVALQNGNSASASEIVLGNIQDNGAGKTVGENSYGKGLVQNVYPLESGAGLKVTTARYKTAGERDIHKVGIQPDVVCPMPEGTDVFASLTMDPQEDPQLAKALEVLQQEITAAQAPQTE